MNPKIEIDSDIKKAYTLPSDYYKKENYYNNTLEKIFSNSFQFIIHEEQIKKKSKKPFIFLDGSINEPMLFTNNNKIRCLSNVCTHRAHLVCTEKDTKDALRCRYHGRTFEYDGTIKSTPGFKEAQNFPSESDNLKKFPVINWNGFIFTSINNVFPIQEYLNEIQKIVDWYPFENLVYDSAKSTTYNINSNWAIYCENYLEGFHVPYVHQGLKKDIELSNYKTELGNHFTLQKAKSKNTLDSFHKINNKHSDIYALYFWLFPNTMLNFYPWGISINVIEPTSINTTRVKFYSYPIKNHSQPNSGDSDLNTIELEDQEVVKNVQIGINSRTYNKGRYSPKNEIGIHYFHSLIAKYLL